jgi:hypothetical protein
MRFDSTLGFPGEGPGPGVLKRVFDYVTSFGMEWQNNSIQAFNGTKFVVTVPYPSPTTSPHTHRPPITHIGQTLPTNDRSSPT